jgi:hypothetical protein
MALSPISISVCSFSITFEFGPPPPPFFPKKISANFVLILLIYYALPLGSFLNNVQLCYLQPWNPLNVITVNVIIQLILSQLILSQLMLSQLMLSQLMLSFSFSDLRPSFWLTLEQCSVIAFSPLNVITVNVTICLM